jgi:phosphoribosylformimino-5-aminoimidazole carboxamide ribotide isomerase
VQILPVIDLLQGQVVRGIAGRRADYKPMISRLTTSTDPIDVALAFRDHFGFDELYVADLDAIAGAPPAVAVFAELQRRGFCLWVDAGLCLVFDMAPLMECGVACVVAGLETVHGPAAFAEILEKITPRRVVFSLDLKEGRPLGAAARWSANDPFAIAAQAVALGVERILVLDLARVGAEGGAGTEPLCRSLRKSYPHLEITAGGGVRDLHDVTTLQLAGVDRLLVASALHDGRLTRPMLGL